MASHLGEKVTLLLNGLNQGKSTGKFWKTMANHVFSHTIPVICVICQPYLEVPFWILLISFDATCESLRYLAR